MQNKFTQPVSMRVTKEQYKKDLREPLLRMGYLENVAAEWMIVPILVTNYGNTGFYISNTINEYKKKHNRHFIDHYNPKLFLAIAAMSDVQYGIYGEWWCCTEDVKMSSDGRIEYNKDKLYMGLDNERIVNNSRNENHYWRGDYRFEHFRKATLQELITNFTESKQENIMKKEITTELIEELKNLIAPENEEQFNKLMGIEKPMFKKEDFVTGDKVVLRNGEIYLVIRDCNTMNYGVQLFALVQIAGNGGFHIADDYGSNLKKENLKSTSYDIMKVYREGDAFINGCTASDYMGNYSLIWSRE